jgi:membrane protease YdiL (CAAX protease family)
MKNKNMWLLTVFSLSACALHTAMLSTQFNQYAYTSVFKVVIFILCPLIYFLASKDGKFTDLFLFKGDKKNIMLSFVLGFCVFVFMLAAFMILRQFLDRTMIVDTLANTGITGANFLLVFIYIVLINAALEEIFFRGFVFMTLYRMDLKRYAHAYSCLLFAFYHVAIVNNAVTPGAFILCIAGLALAGLIFNKLVIRCKSIIGSLAVHISANLAINLIGVYYLFAQ